jgi:hypothetical protein
MSDLKVVEFMLGNVKCTKRFDRDGRIVVDGPAEAIDNIKVYMEACNEFCEDPGFLACAIELHAETAYQLNTVKHAIVDVMYDNAVKASRSGRSDATFTSKEVKRGLASLKLISRACH